VKVGLGLGYWQAEPPPDLADRICVADELGFDSVWVAESWGSDALVNATWVAAHTRSLLSKALFVLGSS
jgi:alkanesulfonate monooxygenase SsuD/methylene tetrahydromethanopterin reductase-like flavin-dependent oxidoreductase (luciferase family)